MSGGKFLAKPKIDPHLEFALNANSNIKRRILAWDICFFDGVFIGGEFMSDVVIKDEGVEGVAVASFENEEIVTEVLPNSEVLEVANEIIDENIEALRALAK